MKYKIYIAVFTIFFSLSLTATPVDEALVRTAALSFITNDPIGSSILSGSVVNEVASRDELWIVSLKPHGHIIIAGSDLIDPIVGFSKNDFSEPDPNSPAFSALEASAMITRNAEASGRSARHRKWEKLIGCISKTRLSSSSLQKASVVHIEPFMDSHFNQCQPYNDYCPLYEAVPESKLSYRGRCPSGCVATAAAAILHYFRWPARIDGSISCNHTYNGAENSFPVRFDGHIPINWNDITTNYVYSYRKSVTNFTANGGYTVKTTTDYDLHGEVAESVRYPISRLLLWADELADMDFAPNGSGSNYNKVSNNLLDWYTPAQMIEVTSAVDPGVIIQHLQAGIPISVSIPNHAVVAHGFTSDGDSSYLYFNYGWGGSNDGYYNLNPDEADAGTVVERIYLWHYPRAKPQIDPLPKISENSLVLRWHFPDIHTNDLAGFTVFKSKISSEVSTFTDDFSESTGISSSKQIYVTTDTDGGDGKLLFTKPNSSGTYTFENTFMLTSASELSFKLYSFAALGAIYQIEASFDGGDWEVVYEPRLTRDWSASGWSKERVFLGSHGGRTVKFRLKNRCVGYYYPQEESRILMDDFCVTDALLPENPEQISVVKEKRDLRLSGLTPGATYFFSVKPVIGNEFVEGEVSDSVIAVIEGERRLPQSGEEMLVSTNLYFSTEDTSEIWSYSGTARTATSLRDTRNNSVFLCIPVEIAKSSLLSFSWKADNYYGDASSYDVLSAVFLSDDGTDYTLCSITNTTTVSAERKESIRLPSFLGMKGKIKVSYRHYGSYYTSDARGGTLSDVSLSNVLMPSSVDVIWKSETNVALGTPEIKSVSNVTEGFYGECGLDTSIFSVTCSKTVVRLSASPSHLALVGDDDVTVIPRGDGRFFVKITPSGINEHNLRSRMILTLKAVDANGTTAYKDLSLRFEEKDASASVLVSARSVGGSELTVDIPYLWFVECDLAQEGASAEVFEGLADMDSDGDGQVNWFEYICGTNPSDAAEKLICYVEVVNGQGKVTYKPDKLRTGFKAVIKGTDDLRSEKWTTVTTATSPLHFFTVVLENE